MKVLYNILDGYGYESGSQFIESLAPSLKYNLTVLMFSWSLISAYVEQYFGISIAGLIAFVIIMPVELISGIQASRESFSSKRFSRFLFKLSYYLVLIYVTHIMALHYKSSGNSIVGGMFQWVNNVIVVHIVVENVISIMENIAAIEGKPKGTYISLIKNKLKNYFKDDESKTDP